MKKGKAGCAAPIISFGVIFALIILLQEFCVSTIPGLDQRLDTGNKVATYGWIALIGVPLILYLINVVRGRLSSLDTITTLIEESYWTNEIHSLVRSCYNETTHEFNWERYWHEYTDNLIETPSREAYLKSELRSVAYGQLSYIKLNLYEEEPDYSERFIKGLSWTIITNIPMLYSSGDSNAVQVKELLSEIKSSKKPCTAANIRRLRETISQMYPR